MTATPPPQVPSYRSPGQDQSQPNPEIQFRPPLKPRPMVFVALCLLLAAWLATIIVMRFTTVHREPAPATSQDLSRPG